jgi:hypothetical protein
VKVRLTCTVQNSSRGILGYVLRLGKLKILRVSSNIFNCGGRNLVRKCQFVIIFLPRHHEAYYRPYGTGLGLCLYHHFSFCHQGRQALNEVRYVTQSYALIRYAGCTNDALLSTLASNMPMNFRPLGSSSASFLVESPFHLLTLASPPSNLLQCCQHGQAGPPRRHFD